MSSFDAFLALKDLDDEEFEIPASRHRRLKEGKSFDVRDDRAMEVAKKFTEEKEETELPLEVYATDPITDNDIVNHREVVGQRLCKCGKCHATRVIDINNLQDNGDGTYSIKTGDNSCPSCHDSDTTYTITGMVGEAPENKPEPKLDNDQSSPEVGFDNDEMSHSDTEGEPVVPTEEETPTGPEITEPADEPSEGAWDETDAEDDTADMADTTGDEFNPDDVKADDTAGEEPFPWEDDLEPSEKEKVDDDILFDEPEDKEKKESLNEDLYNRATVEELFDTIIEPSNIRKVNIFDVNGNEIYSGECPEMDNEYSTPWLTEEILSWDVADGRLILNVSEDRTGTVLNTALVGLDPNTDEIDLFDVDADEEVYTGSYLEVIEEYGEFYSLVSIEAPDMLNIVVDHELSEDLENDDPDDEDWSDEPWYESLTKKVCEANNLRYYRAEKVGSQEYWIRESIKAKEDLGVIYQNFLKGVVTEDVINQFKAETGFRTPLDEEMIKEYGEDKFLEGIDVYGLFVNEVDPETGKVKHWDKNASGMDNTKPVEIGTKQEMTDKKDSYTDSWNVNRQGKVYKFTVKWIGRQNESLAHGEINEGFIPFRKDFRSREEAEKEIKDLMHKVVADYPSNHSEEELAADWIEGLVDNPDGTCTIVIPQFWTGYLKYWNWDNVDERMSGAETLKHNIETDDYIDPATGEHDPEMEKEIRSFKTRKELGEAIQECKNNNQPYKVTKSLTEGYRYDLLIEEVEEDKEYRLNAEKFAKEIKSMSLEEVEDCLADYNFEKTPPEDDVEEMIYDTLKARKAELEKPVEESLTEDVTKFVNEFDIPTIDPELAEELNEDNNMVPFRADPEVEVIDAPVPNENAGSDIVPADMRPEDVEIVQKLMRISTDTANAIREHYGIEADPRLILADMIQDLRLIGGSVRPEELANTPMNQLTAEMYRQYDGFTNMIEDMFDGRRSSAAQRLERAIHSLDSQEFSAPAIDRQIGSGKFIEYARRGAIPFINPEEVRRIGHED